VSDRAPEPVSTPPTPESSGLFLRLRGHLSLSRVQVTLGIVAALLSIGGSLYGYLRPHKPPDTGELVAVVQDRSGALVADATVEILTPKDALVATVPATTGEIRRPLKEGTYRLKVTHPRYATEVRQIQVVGGQTADIRVSLAPRPTAPPQTPAERAVTEGLEGLKKIFR
jgi:hypothetical protein